MFSSFFLRSYIGASQAIELHTRARGAADESAMKLHLFVIHLPSPRVVLEPGTIYCAVRLGRSTHTTTQLRLNSSVLSFTTNEKYVLHLG